MTVKEQWDGNQYWLGKDDGGLQKGYLHRKENTTDIFEYWDNFTELHYDRNDKMFEKN